MFFVGAFPLTIDAKNRLSIPFVVRDQMVRETDGRAYYVVPGRRRGTLRLYPNAYFENLRDHFYQADAFSEETFTWAQFEYSQAVLLEADNQGRVTIPERLLKWAGLQREITLCGVHDHLEVWDRAAYDAFEAEGWERYEQMRAHAMSELDVHRSRESANETEAAAAMTS